MKTKSIPAMIMLLAGFIACIAGIRAHMDLAGFMRMLLAVLIIFYFLGYIVKIVLDKYFSETEDKKTTDGEESGEQEQEEENPSDSEEEESAPDEDEK